MSLLREVTKRVEDEVEAADEVASTEGQPVTPDGGWSVGHLANHGMLLSCDGFNLKLDLDQLNALFDLAEDGESGEITDHAGDAIYVEVNDDNIVLSRNNDETYPEGIVLDLETLKEMGIEQHEAARETQPTDDSEGESKSDTIEPEDELQEGVKRAFRRVGKKIKRGFRVTSGFRKGRVVSSSKAAFKPRAKARTRMKLRIAAKRKRIVRILKGKITRRKSTSRRLVAMNKRIKK